MSAVVLQRPTPPTHSVFKEGDEFFPAQTADQIWTAAILRQQSRRVLECGKHRFFV